MGGKKKKKSILGTQHYNIFYICRVCRGRWQKVCPDREKRCCNSWREWRMTCIRANDVQLGATQSHCGELVCGTNLLFELVACDIHWRFAKLLKDHKVSPKYTRATITKDFNHLKTGADIQTCAYLNMMASAFISTSPAHCCKRKQQQKTVSIN